eukprot:7733178-Pyramimonas_sp.AAC.1
MRGGEEEEDNNGVGGGGGNSIYIMARLVRLACDWLMWSTACAHALQVSATLTLPSPFASISLALPLSSRSSMPSPSPRSTPLLFWSAAGPPLAYGRFASCRPAATPARAFKVERRRRPRIGRC